MYEANSIMMLVLYKMRGRLIFLPKMAKPVSGERGFPELMPSAPYKPTPPSPGTAHQADSQGKTEAEDIMEEEVKRREPREDLAPLRSLGMSVFSSDCAIERGFVGLGG